MAAWAYRGELRTKLRAMKYLALPSALGGLVGARFLMSSEERLFGRIVPWMALTATMFIVLRDFLVKRGALGVPPKRARPTRLCAMGLAVFAVAIYGGYFGAGKNIILLAVLTLLQRMSIHEVNAVKSLVVGTLTLVSSTYFIFNGVANLEAVAVLACGSMLGSYLGASTARRVNPTLIRHAVVGIGLTLTTLLGYKQWLSESRATEADHQLTLSH